jgi:hypothetical protein
MSRGIAHAIWIHRIPQELAMRRQQEIPASGSAPAQEERGFLSLPRHSVGDARNDIRFAASVAS